MFFSKISLFSRTHCLILCPILLHEMYFYVIKWKNSIGFFSDKHWTRCQILVYYLFFLFFCRGCPCTLPKLSDLILVSLSLKGKGEVWSRNTWSVIGKLWWRCSSSCSRTLSPRPGWPCSWIKRWRWGSRAHDGQDGERVSHTASGSHLTLSAWEREIYIRDEVGELHANSKA